MEKEKSIVIFKNTITIEVDERADACDNFKDAIKCGYAKIIGVDVHVSTESGNVYDDEGGLENIRQAIIYGLEEKG